MQNVFDSFAENYDEYFTNSIIGTAQRNIVHAYLNKIFTKKSKLNILELNCGTGEDALWFSQFGHRVLATDISEKMLTETEKKIKLKGNPELVKTYRFDLRNPEDFKSSEKFDMIFSNFGGVNCLTPPQFEKLPGVFKHLLNPHGRVILILMPKFCSWEFIYFVLKLKIKKSLRRFSKEGALSEIDGNEFRVYYYSPGYVKKTFSTEFETIAINPVGFFIPPSYLEFFFKTKKRTFKMLDDMEHIISNSEFLAGFSDHFLIDLRVRE